MGKWERHKQRSLLGFPIGHIRYNPLPHHIQSSVRTILWTNVVACLGYIGPPLLWLASPYNLPRHYVYCMYIKVFFVIEFQIWNSIFMTTLFYCLHLELQFHFEHWHWSFNFDLIFKTQIGLKDYKDILNSME